VLIYRVFYKLILNLIQFTLWIEKIFSFKLIKGKMAQIIEQKNSHLIFYRNFEQFKTAKTPLWIHAASGELEYAKPLLREIKKQNPKQCILVTYFSPSALPMIEKTKEIDIWAPLPWDTDDEIINFLNKFDPQILILARTDLWPNVIHRCKNRKIKTILMGATFAEGSKKIKGLGKWVTKLALQNLDSILLVTKSDQQMLESIYSDQFTNKTLVIGDPRMDQVYYRIQEKRILPQDLTKWASENLLMVAGSTWPEDEEPLLKAVALLNNLNVENKKNKILLVPHENTKEHIESLKRLCISHKLSVSVWTESLSHSTSQNIASQNIASQNIASQNITSQILIFDQMGYLSDLYQLAPLAFVGGSFRSQVHSVMEALAYGCKVLVGPHYKNNREAIAFVKLQFVIPCEGYKDLIKAIQIHSLDQKPERLSIQRQIIQDKIFSQRGATQIVFTTCRDALLATRN
jgi:3-deoxy-D-manno-octulosonic-acid transferase